MPTRTKTPAPRTKTTAKRGRKGQVPKQGGLAGVLSVAAQVLGKDKPGAAKKGRGRSKATGFAALAATGVGAAAAQRRRRGSSSTTEAPARDLSLAPEVPATGGTPGAQNGDRDIVSPSPAAPMGGL